MSKENINSGLSLTLIDEATSKNSKIGNSILNFLTRFLIVFSLFWSSAFSGLPAVFDSAGFFFVPELFWELEDPLESFLPKISSLLKVELINGGIIISLKCNTSFSKWAVLRMKLCECPRAIYGNILE